MPHRYAVAFTSLHDNDIQIELVVAEDEIDAIKKHSGTGEFEFDPTQSLDEIEQEFFDSDALLDVQYIPDTWRTGA